MLFQEPEKLKGVPKERISAGEEARGTPSFKWGISIIVILMKTHAIDEGRSRYARRVGETRSAVIRGLSRLVQR